MNDGYRRTVELLLDIAPRVFAEAEFAMKGGTAINLFVQPLPRLSVDIDLVFVPRDVPRDEALRRIGAALTRIQEVVHRVPGIHARVSGADKQDVKLTVQRGRTLVKVEVNPVFRGTVYPVVDRALSPAAVDAFKREVRVKSLDTDELYASKLAAAMDRQHPRDLFDVMVLQNDGGVTPRMRRAFVVYVAGHGRPVDELLTPRAKPLQPAYQTAFVGMTREDVPLEALEDARAQLFRALPASIDADERRFLLSVTEGEPEWDLLGLSGIDGLPALRRRVEKIRELKNSNPGKYEKQLSLLREKLGL